MIRIHLSIRWKLTLAIILPLLLITGVVMGITLSRIYGYASSTIQQRTLRELDLTAARIGAQFESLAQVARSTAAFVEVHENLSEQEIYDLLAHNVQQHELIYGSALAFSPFAWHPDTRLFSPYVFGNGEYLQALDIGADAYDYADGAHAWYSEVMKQGKPLWTEAYFGTGEEDVLMTTFAAPVLRHGKPLGVATVDVMLDRLQQQTQAELAGQNFAIIGRTGRFLAHYNDSVVMNSSLREQAEQLGNPDYARIVEQILGGAAGIGELEDFVIDGQPVPGRSWVFYTPIPQTGWTLMTVVAESLSTAELRSFLNLGIAGLVLTVALAFVFVSLVSSRITHPLRQLASSVSNVARGRLDTHIENIRSLDEIGRLSIGFNRMLKNLKKHIEREGRESAARQMVEQELEVARETQKSLLPRDFPPFPEYREFDLHAVNQAARHVAGDFFDFFLVNPRTLMFVIADVSGKGVAAALVMAVTRTIIRNLGKSGKSPAQILAETNALLIDSQKRSAFVTVFIGSYNMQTGRITYANAGHAPPFKIGRDKVRECGNATGTIVGMLDDEQYLNAEIRLNPGETLVLYTDGFSEARSPTGEFYGQSRIREFLEKQAERSPRELCEAACEEICRFQDGNLADDITILALKRSSTRITSLISDLFSPPVPARK